MEDGLRHPLLKWLPKQDLSALRYALPLQLDLPEGPELSLSFETSLLKLLWSVLGHFLSANSKIKWGRIPKMHPHSPLPLATNHPFTSLNIHTDMDTECGQKYLLTMLLEQASPIGSQAPRIRHAVPQRDVLI